MVAILFKGRLGNQLFQYSFLRFMKAHNKGKIFFFPNPHHAYLTRYFELGLYNDLTIGSKLYSIFTRIFFKLVKFKPVYVHNFFGPKKFKAKNFTVYDGYYQSDWYLDNNPEKFEFKIKKKYTDKFDQEFGEIFRNNKTITVHIRRTDYMHYGKRDISLPIEYFQRQLNAIPNLDSYKVFFVSDDIKYVKNVFGERSNFIFSSNNEITDFQIIKNADVAIISNSTFAWWAAYLCDKKNTVIAPKNWLAFKIGREHPKGIMTKKFTWVDVYPEVAETASAVVS
ncbi:alpha-1,2-fucosyltransferase [Foetidibacter luteolus]|uniref:alpha-1,2-fucosyltransferase n=1 Tax=Foetidibacter luteolus TaxID=2608880 RepID=UPI00129AF69B|nr:alpha-1,2-fucosyltransferase [Foetidibacter luteolus]